MTEAAGRLARRRHTARRIGVAAVVIGAVALTACGPARDPIQASSDAATACHDMNGLEQAMVNHQISSSQALQTLNAAKSNADTAAYDDPRWKTLDADVNAVRHDLLGTHVVPTLKVKAIQVAAICAPVD